MALLTEATRKSEPDVVVWTKERIKAFEKLKNTLTSESVLILPGHSSYRLMHPRGRHWGCAKPG